MNYVTPSSIIVVTYVLLFIWRCFLSLFIVEKVLKEDGTDSVVLVDQDYQIVESVALYLEYLDIKGYSKNTIENYCRTLKEYFSWLQKEKLKFYEVRRRDMFSWIEYIDLEAGRKQKKSARTVNTYLSVIASFYDFFDGVGGYIDNPVKLKSKQKNIYFNTFKVKSKELSVNFFKRKETKRKNNKRLFRNEIDLLYKGIEQIGQEESVIQRNKLLFRFLYETGCRIGEALGLRINDFSQPNPNEEIGAITIRKHDPLYHKDHSIKTNERDIPVSMDLIYAMDDYLCNYRPQRNEINTLFVAHGSSSTGDYLIRRSVEEVFMNLSELVGIKCTPHMLRHTHGTELKESGYSEVYIMDRLGHNSQESMNQYMHLSFESQAEAFYRFLQKREAD